MTEATVGSAAPTVKEITRLRGIPVGMLCRAIDVRTEIHLSKETWSLWKQAGLPTLDLGSDGELVLTDHIIEWASKKPTIPKRPPKKKTTPKKGKAA